MYIIPTCLAVFLETIKIKGKKGKTKQKTKVIVDHCCLIGPHLQALGSGLAFVNGLLNKGK